MGEPVEFRYGEIRASINAVRERLANPQPVLKELGRSTIIPLIKANIAAGGPGWKGPAESTMKRLRSTGTSQVSVRGTIRTDRIKRTMKALDRVQKQINENGSTPQLRERFEKLRKRVQNYRKAEERFEKRGLGKRGIGPRRSEGWQLLKNMGKTIRAKIVGRTLYVYSAAGKVADAQNEMRPYFPPPQMGEVMDAFKALMESDLGQAWEQKRAK